MIPEVRSLKLIAIVLCCISVNSCTDNRQLRKEVVLEKIHLLQEDIVEWNILTQSILNDSYVNSHLEKFIEPSQLNDALKEKLMANQITGLTAYSGSGCQKIEYLTNWTEYPVGSLYLIWSTCNTVQTQTGYYLDNFDQNFIEAWGIGNNWMIWVDSDFY